MTLRFTVPLTPPSVKTMKNKRKISKQQILLGIHLREIGVTAFVYEYRFLKDRDFRFDVMISQGPDWPGQSCGIEIDGGMWSGGHKRGEALEEDYVKQNMAQYKGFRIYRFTNRQVDCGEAIEFLKKVRSI